MRRGISTLIAAVTLLLISLVAVPVLVPTFGAGSETETAPTFVGPAACGKCHSSDSKGAQYKVWKDGPHARAYATLGTPEARAVAEEWGVTGNPQEDQFCLECHTTGGVVPLAHGVGSDKQWDISCETCHGSKVVELESTDPELRPEDGVSCEACHGAGSDYSDLRTMRAVFAGEIEMSRVGLVLPTEAVCRTCHNSRSPGFPGFDFDRMSAEIAHPYPEEFAARRGDGY